MVSKKNAKMAALICAASIIAMSLCSPDWNSVGVARGSSILTRLSYPFFHASLIHALINAWCLLSAVFLFPVSLRRMLVSFIVAFCVPGSCLSDTPTVGLSCVCYALLGSVSFMVSRPALLRWFLCMALYIGGGFMLPSVNALAHLYGYLAGLSVGLLTSPFPWIQKSER